MYTVQQNTNMLHGFSLSTDVSKRDSCSKNTLAAAIQNSTGSSYQL
jgi:hypothetical protein